MEISKISSKGQVTIPKGIRELLQLDAGDRILFIEENGRAYITKASLVAIHELQRSMEKQAEEQGVTDQEFELRQTETEAEAWGVRRR